MNELRKATIKLYDKVGEKKGKEILRKLAKKIEAGEMDEVLERIQKELGIKG